MKKLTTSVLAVVLTSSFTLVSAQEKDSIKTQTIGEVVITGALGISKKADAQTSAMQVVTNEKITAAGNPSSILALQGKVSGVSITNTNSSVSSSPKIQFRGTRSLTGNNNALVVIDNVISSAAALNQLSPELIESVNMMKGSQAAALYGSDGVNGVVLVTTKRGTKGRLKVSYNGVTDFESVAWLPKRQRNYGQGWTLDKINVENGAWGPAFNSPLGGQTVGYGIPLYDYNNDGTITINPDDSNPTPDDPAMIQSKFAPYGKDNVRDFFTTGTIFSNGITANAGDENGYILMSVDHMEREFIIQDDKLKRLSAFLKAGTKFKRWNFEAIVQYTRQFVSTTDSGLYEDLLQSSSDIPIVLWKNYPDNSYAWNKYYRNPYWSMKHIRNNSTTNRFNLVGSVGFKVNNNIDVMYRSNLNYFTGFNNGWNDGWKSILLTDVNAITSTYSQTNYDQIRYYGDLLVNFNYALTDDLGMKLNVGHNFQNLSYGGTSAGGSNIIIPGVYTVWNLANPSVPYNLNNDRGSNNSQAVFANLDLDFKNYLYLTATARKEWMSNLPEENRGFFFPSVGLSFVPTKAFDISGGLLNYMKIYGSIMGTANATSVGTYSIRNYYGLGTGFPFTPGGGISFVAPSSETDRKIRPEKVSKKELGISLGFFKDNRILLNASVYQDDTTDLITRRNNSVGSGISSTLTNIGKLRNQGLDADINVTPLKNDNLRWDIGANFTTWRTNVIEVAPDADRVSIGGSSLVGIYAVKGENGLQLMGTDFVRDDQGRIIVNATNGRPSVTSTLVNLGRVDADWLMGFNTSFSYKGLKLSATADWRKGGKMTTELIRNMAFNGIMEESGSFDREKGFIMPNSVYLSNGQYVTNTNVPYINGTTGNQLYNGVEYYYQSQFGTVGSLQVVDASFFKIREVALSYSFSPRALSGSFLTGLTIGVHARNIFTKFSESNRNYADPESSYTTGNAQGYSTSGQYPAVKTFGLSVNANF